ARLVEAHHRPRRVVRRGVQLQHVLHPPDELAVYPLREPPRPLLPGLERVLLSTRRTVPSDTDSTTSTSTRRSARIFALQRARPRGALEQASTRPTASALPSSFAGTPRRGLSVRAAPSPSVANRRRVLKTVPAEMPRPSAISPSVSPRSARSRTWMRFRCLRVSGPANRSSRAALWSSVNRTTCRFSIPAPPLQDRIATRLSIISAG